MSTWNYGQLEQLWLNTAKGTKFATKAWASLMAAIAMAESAGNDQALNSIQACGLWQIHPYQNGCLTPQANAKMALQKLQSQGLGAWQTWTEGSYRKFLKGNVPPDANSPGGNTTSNQPQSAQLTSWNPITQAISEFNPFLGALIGGFKGTPSGIGDLASGVGGLVTDFAAAIKLVSWLFVPQHWLRIAAFISGLLLLAGSAYMFKEAL
jgi:Transglycosylase SLT domain